MENDKPIQIDELLKQTPQLQKLAAQLARGWDQDDVVQETWLRTLQSPPKNRRNLRGWLTGSLRHRAADHHRREASQRERAKGLESAHSTDAQREQSTPPELLARTEAHQAVVACLADLEDPFRHTLILHYFEGLSVTEIASKLAAPKPTISSRLKRGRERLREMMQARYGSSAYGICAAAAGPFAPATLGVGTSSAAVAKSWFPAAGIVAAAVLVGGVAFLNSGLKPNSIEPARAQATLTENSAASAGQTGSQAGPVRLASERDSKDNKHEVGSEGGDLVRIKGRCVDAISGMAIPDALVKVNFRSSDRNNEALHGNPDWQAPGDTRTDASGDFLVEFEESLSHQLSMSIEPIGYCPRTARWSLKYDGLLAGTTTDLGEIRFELGHTITGTALDQDGDPIEGLQVSLANLPLPIAVDSSPNDTRSGVSDALGNFTISVAVPPGRYPVQVSDYTGYGSYEELFLTVGEQGLDGPWTLQVEKLETITGHVIDQNGAPIHRAYISADPEVRTSSKSLTSLTNQDGFFRIRRRYPAGPVRLPGRDSLRMALRLGMESRSGWTSSWGAGHTT